MSGGAGKGLPCGGDPLALNRQLCFALYAASRAMTRAYQPMLQAMDITYPQYLVLLVLWEQVGTAAEDGTAEISVGALGRQLMLDSGTLTPLLKRMAARGLVSRHRGRGDERVTMIALTDAGRALRPHALAWVEQQLDDASISPGEVEQLRTGLWNLLEKLGAGE
ncbi:MarR family transcriptional regulator [Microbulbifer sp. SAOS-129_SWC]|uniref:MarR family winged helix-turn-helix transcriptional regulator n=1 Tax=Microbulbifer sp. SAOS-129_SWC TaxID=3145235 RepID=UPI003216955E